MATPARPSRPRKPRTTRPKKRLAGRIESAPLLDELPEASIGRDELSEALAEAAIAHATGADHPEEALRDQVVEEDEGGPFVITAGRKEFAPGTDASNPEDAFREPLPKV